MRHFKNPQGEVFAYDDADDSQLPLIEAAETKGWQDVSKAWPPPPSLADAKARQIDSIKAGFETVLDSGYQTSFGFRMDATLEALQKLKTGYDFARLMNEATMPVVDYDNLPHANLPLADVEKIMQEVGGHYRSQYMLKQQLRGQVGAASTVEAVQAVNWPAG
jgi:hypothetical protein